MSTITLNLPEDIDRTLSTLTVKREEFLLEALKDKIKAETVSNLETLLIEGYKERCAENSVLVEEFTHVDMENWHEY